MVRLICMYLYVYIFFFNWTIIKESFAAHITQSNSPTPDIRGVCPLENWLPFLFVKAAIADSGITLCSTLGGPPYDGW